MIEGEDMKKILIVDDEQDIVESLKFVLETADFTCYCAYNGEDGLRMKMIHRWHLLCLNIKIFPF